MQKENEWKRGRVGEPPGEASGAHARCSLSLSLRLRAREQSRAVTQRTLLLAVVVVGGRQQVAKDELGHVDVVLLVHDDGHAGACARSEEEEGASVWRWRRPTAAARTSVRANVRRFLHAPARSAQLPRRTVVPDGELVGVGVDDDLELAHARVAALVVGGVDEDLVKDLVEPRHVRDALLHDALVLGVPHVHGRRVLLRAADVAVRPQQDVLQLRLLRVDLLQRLAILLGRHPRRPLARNGRVHARWAATGRLGSAATACIVIQMT